MLLTHARLDWTDRRPPPACSANGRYACHSVLEVDPHTTTTISERISHACARRALPPNLTSTSRACQTACCLPSCLAALDGDPARRALRSVGRLATDVQSARGASRLVAWRHRRGGRARSVLHARVRPRWDYGIRSHLPADRPRVRSRSDLADRRRSL
jgi:hypothetical protein